MFAVIQVGLFGGVMYEPAARRTADRLPAEGNEKTPTVLLNHTR